MSQILWTDYLTPHFHVFVALSILVTFREKLLSGHLSENDILEVWAAAGDAGPFASCHNKMPG